MQSHPASLHLLFLIGELQGAGVMCYKPELKTWAMQIMPGKLARPKHQEMGLLHL